ncbi:MAG: S9 family peptidase [Deltaproteobacteria bacterium]|nr:S9 family peptidase [Deltaproteobacteria bacterium]
MNVKRPVTDVLHGESIVDPYRWLEDGDSKETKAWTEAQNARTRAWIDAGDLRGRLRARLDELLSIGFVASPVLRTGTAGKGGKQPRRYFHVRREGKQDQPIVYVREGQNGSDRALLDPTTFGADKTSALDWWYVSQDGARVAYGASVSGDEQSTLRVRDVESGKDLADEIPRTRMSSVAWLPDGSGFFYTREPEPGTVPKDEEHYHRKVYEHRIGRHWRDDPLIFPLPSDTRWKMTDFPSVLLSPSGRWLAVRVFEGWAKSSVLLKDLADPKADFVTVVTGVEALFDPMFHRQGKDDLLFMRSNEGAPNFELYRVDPKKPQKEGWKKIVAEGPDPIRGFDAAGDALFLGYLHRASSRLERRTLDGKLVAEIPLGTVATASVPHGDLDGDDAMFEVQSYATPPSIKRIDLKKGAVATWATIDSSIDSSNIAIDQIEARSKDGTPVTAFVVRRKDVPRDGSAPGILYGYGGFNISQTPTFNRTLYSFLERGGVYCVANLRGGAEYGETWHRAGMLDKKQNVFDDAVAVAEKILADKWVSSSRLGVLGGSNGGLLVGALITQRPELFRAAVSAVPLLDMLRYHHFLVAKLWIPEYGSPEDAKAFQWLKAYSPYHHVVDGAAYPSVLFMTAESDSRVDPMHARKMAARMQEATSSGRPILVRIETKAGHGVGKPRHKQLEELADEYTFFFRELGLAF